MEEQTALITGANGGIGQALVKAFNEAGYRVIATDIAPPAAELAGVDFVVADLQQTAEDEAYAGQVFTEIRRCLSGQPLKALINNAAVQILGNTEKLTRQDWRKTLDVNLLAPFFWIQAFLPEMETAEGSVVNISSIHATLTKPGFSAYATSKAALSGVTRSLAMDLGERVRVNAISPAAIATPMLTSGFIGHEAGLAQLSEMHPIGRIGKPAEVAALALFLASEAARFITGAEFPLDGGIGGRLHDPV